MLASVAIQMLLPSQHAHVFASFSTKRARDAPTNVCHQWMMATTVAIGDGESDGDNDDGAVDEEGAGNNNDDGEKG